MRQFSLTNENIVEIIDIVKEHISESKLQKENKIQLAIYFEEMLIIYKNRFGENCNVRLEVTRRFRRTGIKCSIEGPAFNPLEMKDEDDSNILKRMLSLSGMAPSWDYSNGENILEILLKKKSVSQPAAIGIAIAAAVVSGVLVRFFPASARQYLSENVISPVNDAFLGLIVAFAIPMIFFSVLGGLCGIGDRNTFNRIGKSLLWRYVYMTVILTIFAGILIFPFFSFNSVGEAAQSGDFFSGVLLLVLGIVPGNIIEAFIQGNTIQIIFIAVVIGIVLITLGSRGNKVVGLIMQMNDLFYSIMDIINSIIPVYIFICLFNMLIGDKLEGIVDALKMVLLGSLLFVPIVILYTILVRIRTGIPLKTIIKNLMPGCFITLTTASSAAALTTCKENCINGFNVDKKFVGFALPLGQSLYNLNYSILYFCLLMGMTEIYNYSVSPIWIVSAVIVCILTGMATPPVPGGAMSCIAMLFTQMGIPGDAMAMAMPIAMILDFPTGGIKMFAIQSEIVIMAKKMNLIGSKKQNS